MIKQQLPVAAVTVIFAIVSLFIASLNSGSNGNCYYIGNNEEAVLIDAGLSCRETEKRMRRLSLDINKVKALFISHEHGDHIRGVEGIAGKHRIPIYITETTFRHSRLRLNEAQRQPFAAYRHIAVGSLNVLAFPKTHDAADPHSFVISSGGVNIGVFTDIGTACTHVIDNFTDCHAVFLEANYDEHMLETGRYPYHLKRRIRGGEGHLSNTQALELFMAYRKPQLSHLLLSHLSADNNDPDVALNLFWPHAGNTHVAIASRYQESPVYKICNEIQPGPAGQVYRPAPGRTVQATLF